MKVKDMIKLLKDMPLTADLKIEVNAYYFEGEEFMDVDEPTFDKKKHIVVIGEVYANP